MFDAETIRLFKTFDYKTRECSYDYYYKLMFVYSDSLSMVVILELNTSVGYFELSEHGWDPIYYNMFLCFPQIMFYYKWIYWKYMKLLSK